MNLSFVMQLLVTLLPGYQITQSSMTLKKLYALIKNIITTTFDGHNVTWITLYNVWEVSHESYA